MVVDKYFIETHSLCVVDYKIENDESYYWNNAETDVNSLNDMNDMINFDLKKESHLNEVYLMKVHLFLLALKNY